MKIYIYNGPEAQQKKEGWVPSAEIPQQARLVVFCCVVTSSSISMAMAMRIVAVVLIVVMVRVPFVVSLHNNG